MFVINSHVWAKKRQDSNLDHDLDPIPILKILDPDPWNKITKDRTRSKSRELAAFLVVKKSLNNAPSNKLLHLPIRCLPPGLRIRFRMGFVFYELLYHNPHSECRIRYWSRLTKILQFGEKSRY